MYQELLRKFSGDVHTKEALFTFLEGFLEQEIITRAKQGKEVKSLAEAINEMSKAFEKLDIEYGITGTKAKETNQAR